MTRTKPQTPVMNKIANKIETAIKEAIESNESELVVERRNTESHIDIKVSNPQAYVLSLSDANLVLEAINDMVEENKEKVFIIFDTDPVICNIGVIYLAVLSITIHK